MLTAYVPSTPMSNDSVEKQNPSVDKRKSPIETSRIPNSKKASYNSTEKQNPSLDKRKSPIETSQIPNSKKAKINPDESLAELKKKGADFNVERAVFWEKEERLPFMFVANALNAISEDPGLITKILCNMLRTVIETAPNDLVAVMYLLSESIVPFQPTYLYIEFAQYILAIANACRAEVKDIENDLKVPEDFGGLSLVAHARLSSSTPTPGCPLTAVQVYETIKELAMKNDRPIKTESIKSLLVKATGCEPPCLIHMLQRLQKLPSVKLLWEEQTLLTALGHAALYSKNPNADPLELEDAAKVVKEVYSVVPIYDNLVPDLLRVGVWKLRETCTIVPGIPFFGMLPDDTILSFAGIFDKLRDREFICEYYYYGKRAMIHYSEEGKMEVYSITGLRMTDCYLDAGLDAVRLKHPSVTSFIIECQFVEEEIQTQKEPIKACMYAFDMLYLNGELLLQKQLKVRRELLHRSFEEQTGAFQFSPASTSTDLKAIEKFYVEAVNSGCVGLLSRTLTKDAGYEPATLSENWLVLSECNMEQMGPTLNLVPIAALHRGHHKPGDDVTFLLACYDSYEKEFQTVCTMSARGCKTSAAILEQRYEILRSNNKISDAKPNYNYEYPKGMEPEWFEPTEVWEVRCPGLYEDVNKRFILEHPDFVRVLANKSPTQASSSDEVVELSDELMARTRYLYDEEDFPDEEDYYYLSKYTG